MLSFTVKQEHQPERPVDPRNPLLPMKTAIQKNWIRLKAKFPLPLLDGTPSASLSGENRLSRTRKARKRARRREKARRTIKR
jgi:hypothetical protein